MATRGRAQGPLSLSTSERRRLSGLIRSNQPPAVIRRAKVILACADGLSNTEVAARVGVHHQTVASCLQRYRVEGLPGLHDRFRPGRPHSATIADVRRLLVTTISSAPEGGGSWSPELMRPMGWSPRVVKRIWQECGVSTTDVECRDIKDGLWVDGEWHVAGFYRGDIGRAVVVSLSDASAWGREPAVVTGTRQVGNGIADCGTKMDFPRP